MTESLNAPCHPASRHRGSSRPMWHTFRLGFAMALAMAAVTPAQAQAPGASMPTIFELHKIPVGSWSEYSMTIEGQPPMSQRVAVVARGEDTTTLEVSLQGGPVARAGAVIVQATMASDPKQNYALKRLVMKVGDKPAMEMPPQMQEGQSPVQWIDPAKLKGKIESVKVPAGNFKARRYVDAHEDASVTVWVSQDVPPLGLVKMEGKNPMGSMLVQLVRRGDGAKSSVGKDVQPFDPQALMQMFGSMNDGSAPQDAPASAAPAQEKAGAKAGGKPADKPAGKPDKKR